MPSHESFYRAVKEAGGVLKPSTQKPPFDWLSEMALSISQQIKDTINKRSDILWPLGDIKNELVSNPTFNAFAHHEQGQEGIAVYSGLFYLLFDLSSALWSHSSFLKRTHPTKNNAEDISVLIERMSPIRNAYVWNGPMGIYTKDRERVLRAFNTAISAYIFIYYHEVGHLVRAHIPFLQEQNNTPLQMLFEHNNTVEISGDSTLQLLEIDADIYAARALADCALTTWKMGKIFPVNHPIARGSLSLYLTDLAMAFIIAFFCMDIISCDSRLKSTSTHPKPAVRLAIAYIGLYGLSRNPFDIPGDKITKSFLIAFQEIKEFWEILKLPARTLVNDIRIVIEYANQLFQKRHSTGAILRPSMDLRLKMFGTNMEYYDQFTSFYSKNEDKL